MSKNVVSGEKIHSYERTDKVEESYAQECVKTAGEAKTNYAVEKNKIGHWRRLKY